MSLTEQTTLYAAVILVMLTLLRLISGITGSKSVKRSILITAVYSAIAMAGAWGANILLGFNFFNEIVAGHRYLAKVLSLLWQALWFLLVIYHFALGVLFRLYVRSTRFKDWGVVQNLREIPPLKELRHKRRKKQGDKKGYETNPPRNAQHDKTLEIFRSYLSNDMRFRRPLLISSDSPWSTRIQLIHMILKLAKETEEEFNYVCCTVSPSNIWTMFIRECKDDECLKKLKSRLVFVDAYTETFGFGDEILLDRVGTLRTEERLEIVSCSSAAGVHKGTTDAFKILKQTALNERRTREACTIIYDTLSSLAITETEEEIAEFIIHLAAAEHTYDMQTIFLEPDLKDRKSKSLDAIRATCGAAILVAPEE